MDSDLFVKSWGAGEVDAFAYFVDPDELAVLAPGWPEGMRLLLCMDAVDLCEFVVFHDEEEDSIFERVSEILDKPVGSFAVSPDVEGHPSRRLLFSEENALFKAIQSSDSLQEIAADYLINYNFAREEGLDFDKLMRPRQSEKASKALLVNTDKIFSLASRSGRKKFKKHEGPPQGYASADEVSPEECFYLSLEMWLVGKRIRIGEAPDQPLSTVPTLAREIAFRDDFSSVFFPRNILPSRWSSESELAIDIPVELFPAGFSKHCGRRKVQVAVMPRGIFVEFGAAIPAESVVEAAEPVGDGQVAARKLGRGRQLLKNLHVPLIAIVGLCVTGFFSTIIAQPTPSDVVTRNASAPLLSRVVSLVQP